jgi:hypothetical protein
LNTVDNRYYLDDKFSTAHLMIKILGRRFLEMEKERSMNNNNNISAKLSNMHNNESELALVFEDYDRLTSNRRKYAKVEDRKKLRIMASVLLNHVFNKRYKRKKRNIELFTKGFDIPEIIELICKADMNSVGLNGDRWQRPEDYTLIKPSNDIGYGVFPTMCYFNHSCSPNCELVEKDMKLHVYTIRDIEPGEELTISYLSNLDSTNIRRKSALQKSFLFSCECPPGSNPKNCNDNFLREYLCPNCRLFLMIPVASSSGGTKIRTCFNCEYNSEAY